MNYRNGFFKFSGHLKFFSPVKTPLFASTENVTMARFNKKKGVQNDHSRSSGNTDMTLITLKSNFSKKTRIQKKHAYFVIHYITLQLPYQTTSCCHSEALKGITKNSFSVWIKNIEVDKLTCL